MLLRLKNPEPGGRWVTVTYDDAEPSSRFVLEHAPTRWSELLAKELRLEHSNSSTKDVPCSFTELVRLTMRLDHRFTLETVGRHNLENREDLKQRQTGTWRIVDDTTVHLVFP